MGRANQYIQLVKILYCKLPTISKQLPAFPLQVGLGFKLRSHCRPSTHTVMKILSNIWTTVVRTKGQFDKRRYAKCLLSLCSPDFRWSAQSAQDVCLNSGSRVCARTISRCCQSWVEAQHRQWPGSLPDFNHLFLVCHCRYFPGNVIKVSPQGFNLLFWKQTRTCRHLHINPCHGKISLSWNYSQLTALYQSSGNTIFVLIISSVKSDAKKTSGRVHGKC